jgi:hypothetical protein
VPLHPKGKGVTVHFHRLYDLIRGARSDGQSWGKVFDRLVVQAIDWQGTGPHDAGQT